MSVRTLASIALAGASLLSASVAAPIAHADDPLAPIKAAVNRDRYNTRCPALTYSGVLEAIGQAAVRDQLPLDGAYPGYNGKYEFVRGFGDPEADAINDAYKKNGGLMISDCDYTEFGVGFIRDENRSGDPDTVAIVFGIPGKAETPPPVVVPVAPVPVPVLVQCPAGSPTPTVPAGGTCAAVPPAPTDAVQVSFKKGSTWTVTVTSTADISGTCTYAATNRLLADSIKDFEIGPKGSVSFTAKAAPPLLSYHVVVSCSGVYLGKIVEFGHFEKDVPA